MTKDELQKAVDDVIADCIRNDYAFGSYAYKVAEAIWPLLEAAEKSDAESLAMYRRARDERDALRAKIEAMERQKPVGKFAQHPSNGLWEQDGYGDNPEASPLYALPGAKALLRVPDAVMAALDSLDDYIARIECNDRGACNHINLLRRYLLDATEVGENK